MKEGKDIDKLFKDGLENPDIPFNDLDWDNLEERLYPEQKKRIIPLFWVVAVAGLAAMLLIVFVLVKPNNDKSPLNKIVKVNSETKEIKKSINSISKTTATLESNENDEARKEHSAKNLPVIDRVLGIEESGNRLLPLTSDQVNKNTLANIKPIMLDLSTSYPLAEYKMQKLIKDPVRTKFDKSLMISAKSKPKLVLSILAAPDLTSVQKSGKSNFSGGLGIEATLFLTKKLSVTTGATYAKKIYDSDFSLYNPNSNYIFKVSPSNIHANCDVIDIPINLNYKVFDNRRNSVTVSTGFSSYLMLKEDYYYTYTDSYANGPQSFEVKNQNQHYLGVANVGVEFQHKINNKLSISARPFMKIPLTDIGYGNSKLSSTGVSVSVNMNLFGKGN